MSPPVLFKKVKRNNKKRVVLRAAAILLIGSVLGFFAAGLWSLTWNDRVFTVRYELASDKVDSGFRVLLITDLHLREFGEGNSMLVARARDAAPDIICLGGDMIETYASYEQDEAFVSLVKRLVEIAPVYIGIGNHDALAFYSWCERTDMEMTSFGGVTNLTRAVEEAGAVVLEKGFEDIEINGEKVRLGGFYPFAFRDEGDTDESWESRRVFLEDYCDTELFKLMISHRAVSFYKEDAPENWDIDLVVSGHTHNGVVALPGIGAIWENEGFFPKHSRGMFHEGKLNIVVCAGLDGHGCIPRVFNPPEIVVIDVKAK